MQTLFFGISYVGQKHAMDINLGPYTYTACRFIVSTCFVFLVRPYMKSWIESNISGNKDFSGTFVNRQIDRLRKVFPIQLSADDFQLYFWSFVNGLGLFFANELLQIGLITTTAGKAAFIVGLYVVFIPAMEQLWSGADFCWQTWVAAGMCLVGLFFMSGCVDAMNSGEEGASCSDAIGMGDMFVFASMLAFSAAFMISDTAAKRVDCIDLTCWSHFFATVVCVVVAIVFETDQWISWPPLRVLGDGWEVIALVGVSEVCAMGLGTLGQMYTPAARAALLTSLEASVSAFLAYLFLGEILSYWELFGCFLMLSATLVSTAVLDDEGGDGEDFDGDDDDDEIPDDGSIGSIRRKRARSVRRRRRHFKNVFRRRTKSLAGLLVGKMRTYSLGEMDYEQLNGGGVLGVEFEGPPRAEGEDAPLMLYHPMTYGATGNDSSLPKNVAGETSDVQSDLSVSSHEEMFTDDERWGASARLLGVQSISVAPGGKRGSMERSRAQQDESQGDSSRVMDPLSYGSALNAEYAESLAIPPYTPSRENSQNALPSAKNTEYAKSLMIPPFVPSREGDSQI